jgi:two-component system sensor histidine kinase UhpB
MRWGRTFFKKKYALISLGALLFLAFIICISSITINYVKLDREWALRELEEQVKSGSKQLRFYFEDICSDVVGIERCLANTKMTVGEQLYSCLDFVRGRHPEAIPVILILDTNGNVVASTNPSSLQSNFRESEYFKNTQHTANRIFFSEAITVSDLSGRPENASRIFEDPLDLGFVLYTGVYSKGVFMGAVLFVLSGEQFFNRFSMAITRLTSGYGFILQEDGQILFHRDVELRGRFVSDLPESSDLAKSIDLLEKPEGEITRHCIIGQQIIVASEICLENQRWTIGILTTKSKLAQKTLTLIYTLSGLVLLLGIIVFGLVFALIRLSEAKEALGESEHKYRTLLENLPQKIFLKDKNLIYVSCNSSYARELGIQPEAIKGETDYSFFPDELAEKYRADDRRIIESGETQEIEEKYIRYGEETIIHIVKTPLKGEQGNVIGILGIFWDITERKRAEEALWESEERLRVAGKAAYDLIYEWEVASDVLQWFGDIDGLLGYRKGEISRDINAWLDLIPPEDRVKLENAVEIHRTSTEPIQYEYRVRHKDGTYRHWNDHGLPLLDNKGCPYKWIGVCTDITERKRAEEALQLYVEQLRSLTARLEEVEAVLRQRLAQELHDRVGQNLTAISINLNVVRSMFPAELAKEVGNRLDDSLRLVEQTAEHIRDVMAELRPPVLDDYGLVAALRWYGEQFTDRTGVATVVQGKDWTPRLPASVEMALFRTVQEALTNAAKHAQASQVTVTMEQVAGGARLIIADNGVGFDPMALDRPGKLSGWGLVSMRERAASVGGHLIVKSEPGKGTRVVVEVRR